MRRQRRRTGLIIHDLSLNYSFQSDYRATGLEHLHYELYIAAAAAHSNCRATSTLLVNGSFVHFIWAIRQTRLHVAR